MDNKLAVWNKLIGLDPYRVNVHHNFWGGRYYESSYMAIVVVAHSPVEARESAIVNLDIIEKYLRTLRIRRGSTTIRAIRLSEKYQLTSRDVCVPKKIYGCGCARAFNIDGERIMYEYDNGGDK